MPQPESPISYIPIDNVDSGIVTNLPTTEVVWCNGRNVSVKKGCIYKDKGKSLLATEGSLFAVRDIFTFKGYDNVWRSIVCCDTKIYSYTNNYTSVQDITPTAPPSSGATDVWTFALIGGMPVISNGVNAIWKWADFAGVMTVAVTGIIAKALHSHRNMLILGNIQEGAYSFPARIRWSDILDPSDFGKDLKISSGGADCVGTSTSMEAIDRVQAITDNYRGLVVFTERNIYIGGQVEWPAVYSMSAMNNGIGLIAPRAFVKTPDGAIYFMGQDDFYAFGEGATPIGFPIRNSCFPNLNKAKINTAFAFYKPQNKEVCFVVATGANLLPDTVFKFNTELKVWTIGDCNYLSHSFNFDSTNTTWDTLPFGSWDTITDSRWDSMDVTGILPYEVCGNSTGQILKLDDTNNDNGVPVDAFLESGDMGDGLFRQTIDELYFIFKPQDDISAVMVQIGSRRALSDDIDWTQPMPFTIGVTRKITNRRGGFYNRIRIYSNQLDTPWVLQAYKLKAIKGGNR